MQSIFDSFSDATLRRLFKFVLKRSLGRFLRDELVLEQVTVNSRNGTISIADLELNPQSINNEIFVDSPLKLRRCMIKRLECSMSYNSLLKDGFKTCLYGVDIGIEPNTINTRSESSSSSSSDSDKVPVSGNYYSKSSNSHNSGTTSLKDESANFDSSGLGFLVSWVEVLIHSIQASVHDIEISIASNTSPTCVINISDIQYLNASNSQVNHETSISEASKLYQSSMRGSTSILNDKLLKILKLSGITVCLHNNTGDHTIATFKNTVKIQWEASLYDSTTSLSDCSISTDEIDVALGIRSLKTLTEFLSELLPGTVQPAATSNSQSTLTQIPHSTMKGLEWLNRDIYTEAEESLSGKIDFRRLSELTDMYVAKRCELAANPSAHTHKPFGIESEYFDTVEGPIASTEIKNNTATTADSIITINECQLKIKCVNIYFGATDDFDVHSIASLVNNTSDASVSKCLQLSMESLLLTSTLDQSNQDIKRTLQFSISRCKLLEMHSVSSEESLVLLSFKRSENSRSIIAKPEVQVTAVYNHNKNMNATATTVTTNGKVSVELEPMHLSVYASSFYFWSEKISDSYVYNPVETTGTDQSCINTTQLTVKCSSIDLFLHSHIPADDLDQFIKSTGDSYFDLIPDNQINNGSYDHSSTHNRGLHIQFTSPIVNIPSLNDPMHIDIAGNNFFVALFETNTRSDFRERVIAQSYTDSRESSYSTEQFQLKVRSPTKALIFDPASETTVFPNDDGDDGDDGDDTNNIEFIVTHMHCAMNCVDYHFLQLVSASFSIPEKEEYRGESGSEACRINTHFSFAIRAQSCLFTLSSLDTVGQDGYSYSLLCKSMQAVLSNQVSSHDQLNYVKLVAKHAYLLESKGSLSLVDAAHILIGNIPDSCVTILKTSKPSSDLNSNAEYTLCIQVLMDQFNTSNLPRVTMHVNLTRMDYYFDPKSMWLQNITTLLNSFYDTCGSEVIPDTVQPRIMRLQLTCQDIGIIDSSAGENFQCGFSVSNMTVSSNFTTLSDLISFKILITDLQLRLALNACLLTHDNEMLAGDDDYDDSAYLLHWQQHGASVVTISSLSCLLSLQGYESGITADKRTSVNMNCRRITFDLHRDTLQLLNKYVNKLTSIRNAQQVSVPPSCVNEVQASSLVSELLTLNELGDASESAEMLKSFTSQTGLEVDEEEDEDKSEDANDGYLFDASALIIENFYDANHDHRSKVQEQESTVDTNYETVYFVPAADDNYSESVISSTDKYSFNSVGGNNTHSTSDFNSPYGEIKTETEVEVETDAVPVTSVHATDQIEIKLIGERHEEYCVSEPTMTPVLDDTVSITSESCVVNEAITEEIVVPAAPTTKQFKENAGWYLSHEEIEIRNTHIPLPRDPLDPRDEEPESMSSTSEYAIKYSVRANIQVKFSNSLQWSSIPTVEADDFLVIEQTGVNMTSRSNRNNNSAIEVLINGLVLNHSEQRISPSSASSECMDRQPESETNLTVFDGMITFTKQGHRKRKVVGALKSMMLPRDISVPFITINSQSIPIRVDSSDTVAYRVQVFVIPLRVFLDDEFISTCNEWFKDFAVSTEATVAGKAISSVSHSPSPTISFQNVEISPLTVKLSFKSNKLDVGLLSKGDYSQLLNIFPIDGAVLQLKPITACEITGLSMLMKLIIDSYIKDVFENQVNEILLSGTMPLKGAANVGRQLKKLASIPLNNGGNRNVARELQKSSACVINTLVKETLDASHQIAKFTSETIRDFIIDEKQLITRTTMDEFENQPKGLSDGFRKAAVSIRREMSEAADILIAQPMQQYDTRGAGGVMKSVLKSLPIAIMHTSGGIAEAVSYSLLGLRNNIAPSLRHDDEDIYDIGVFKNHIQD